MSDAGASDRPFAAGMYDYLLGGGANSPADRAAAERIRQVMPEAASVAWANRGFQQRAVRRMAGEWGIRQFLDLGAGLPTQRHTHEVAGPGCRVVYVDNDPRVVERGERLLTDVDGAAVVGADLCDPAAVLDHPRTRGLIDLDRPVGLLLVSVLQFVPDDDDPWGLVRRYMAALAPGSFLALSAPTGDRQAPRIVSGARKVYEATPTPVVARSREQVERFFAGLEVVPPYPGAEPAVTYVGVWGAEDPAAADDDASRWMYAGVARKPEEGPR
ncbi:SAM-dependent methyltransferase [Rhizomonospora bruguierae]|uniref:SAM-dependent methyltransferase n=1 Tax=Rhizomonospora bruguierae TaxID=1581705 RepID=UPI001BCDB2F0|nr:SAM-dependent methyltransferase [Micromonospora sp. NBRC 107566]